MCGNHVDIQWFSLTISVFLFMYSLTLFYISLNTSAISSAATRSKGMGSKKQMARKPGLLCYHLPMLTPGPRFVFKLVSICLVKFQAV